jgi:EAL domain-containing protein (putative c-di-GMP-specific phosphodiesterase class I)
MPATTASSVPKCCCAGTTRNWASNRPAVHQVLEDSGLILEVGTWILDEACDACARMLADGLIDADDFSLCVNISPRQFRQNDFVERVAQPRRPPPARLMLKLEITEGIVIQNLEDTISKMRA